MRKLKNLLPLIAIVLGLSLAFTQSAFKFSDKKRSTQYFKYTGTTFNETNYRDIDNWEYVTDPEEVSCIGETNICVLSVDSDNLTAPGTMLEKLDDFFNTELASPNEVNDYVTDDDHIVAQQN
ncbi:hypothetical protein GM921_03780 [Pedobacter sp. LMG 31464]|uniref:Uncharacterized protein n=2 Tax=Pedobacter planticolens TaxID=2679964 RepID=A0A923DXR2_9SPHI|nr:hypothetical protein [Pedobacter planticolens]